MVRTWNEVDWDQDRPTEAELRRSWAALRWESAPIANGAVDRYLAQVRDTHVNGGCLLGRWRAVGYTDVTAWFLSRNRPEEYGLLGHVLNSDVVRGDLPELRIPENLTSVLGGFDEQWAGALSLDGVLAQRIVHGGAYKQYRGTAAQAKELAGQAVDALVQGRYEDIRVDYSSEPWTPWFGGVAWDSTYVITDRGNAEVALLCITDTD